MSAGLQQSSVSGEKNMDDGFEYNKKARLEAMLSTILSDPILSDVPRRPTLADVDALINLELGSAMRISVERMNASSSSLDVAVLDTATVRDLKQAVERKVDEMQQAELGHRRISWRHVWMNFCMSHNNDKLIDDSMLLQNLGIRNNSQACRAPVS